MFIKAFILAGQLAVSIATAASQAADNSAAMAEYVWTVNATAFLLSLC